jgi:hypothetical protein
VLPATSVAWTEMELDPAPRLVVHVKLEPEVAAAAPLHLTETTPDRLSLSLPLIPTEGVPKVMMDPLIGDNTASSGGVLSTLIVADALAVLPAKSVAVPVTTCCTPSLATVCEAGQTATPETESLHRKVTVAVVLFHPAEFGAGDTVARIVGADLSAFTVSDAVVEFPARSVAVPEI